MSDLRGKLFTLPWSTELSEQRCTKLTTNPTLSFPWKEQWVEMPRKDGSDLVPRSMMEFWILRCFAFLLLCLYLNIYSKDSFQSNGDLLGAPKCEGSTRSAPLKPITPQLFIFLLLSLLWQGELPKTLRLWHWKQRVILIKPCRLCAKILSYHTKGN